MPVLAFVHRGICPPGICPSRHLSAPPPRISVGSGICPDQMWVQAFVLLAFVRSKIDSRHLSDKKLPPGICPPGICPTKKCVQAFVLLAFVRPKSDSWHLSDQKLPPGICPPGICPTKKWLQAFVRPKNASWHLSSRHLSLQKMTPGMCPPGICPSQSLEMLHWNMVQVFVHTCFVNYDNSLSRHLSSSKSL